MRNPAVCLMNGMFLEAYLCAAPEHYRMLEHQYTLLEKCRATQTRLQRFDVINQSITKAKTRFHLSTAAQFAGNVEPFVIKNYQ